MNQWGQNGKGEGKSNSGKGGKPPPKSQPQWTCLCGARNPTGRSECRRCGVVHAQNAATPSATQAPNTVGNVPPTVHTMTHQTRFESMKSAQLRMQEVTGALAALDATKH
eukprot:5504099-Amphidinium_carterae.1